MSPIQTEFEALRQSVVREALELSKRFEGPRTFRVTTRRSDKVTDKTSVDMDREFGAAILAVLPQWKVKLTNPEIVVGVEVRRQESFVWSEKIPGPGGLPIGTNSKVLTLISGGIDSPVAAIQMMKRGSLSHFVHFFGAPFVEESVLDKVEDLCRAVNQFCPFDQKLYVVPFGKLQEAIALGAPSKVRTLLYRRMMMKIAERVARDIGAKALVTGESVGQVASQTIDNLVVTNSATTLPVLRPLIGLDKNEIIEKAITWGTYQTSIRPGTDCCTLFADRHPSLKTELGEIQEIEKKLLPEIQPLIAAAQEGIFVRKLAP